MPTKCKATSPPTAGKHLKKENQVLTDSTPTLRGEDANGSQKLGKHVDDTEIEEEPFDFPVKKYLPKKIRKDADSQNMALNQYVGQKSIKEDIKENVFPNLALNQYLQQKSKTSMQGSLKWKAYLFPPFPKLPS